MKLYYSPGACSLAPHIILEEIGKRFELVSVPLAERANYTEGYDRIHPLRRVPVLEAEGRRLTEVYGILTYLAESNPAAGLLPREPWARGVAAEWAGFLASSLHIAFAQIWRNARFTTDTASAALESISAKGRTHVVDQCALVEERLGRGSWAVGEAYSVIDPYLLVFHRWTSRINLDVSHHTRWLAHTRRVLERPAVQRALAAESLVYAP